MTDLILARMWLKARDEKHKYCKTGPRRCLRKTWSFLLVSTILVGCTGDLRKEGLEETRDVQIRSEKAIGSMQTRNNLRGGGTQTSNGVFMAARKQRSNASALLPTDLQKPNAIVLNANRVMTLPEILERLTRATSLRHMAQIGPSSGGEESDGSNLSFRPDFQGRLSEILDKIAERLDLEWTYQNEQIVFRDYITKQYQISSLPSSISGGSEVGEVSSSYSTDFWSEIEASINATVSEDVNVEIGQGTGLVMVNAKIADHDRISTLIKEINGNLSQQIAFDVNLLTVNMGNTAGLGVDIEAAFEADGSEIVQTLEGNSEGSLSGNTGGVNIAILDGRFSLDVIVQSLRTQGAVSVDTRAGVTTTNNRAVPVEVIDSVAYISGSTIEQNERGGTLVVPQPETAETGFRLQIFPRIMNTREIMVEYAVKISELQRLQNFGEGESFLQLPEISETSFTQQAVLENGQTLAMAGFERTRTRYDKSVGLASLLSGGGSEEVVKEKVATVILIRPRILDTRRSIRAGN